MRKCCRTLRKWFVILIVRAKQRPHHVKLCPFLFVATRACGKKWWQYQSESAQITLDWSNWLCYAPRTFLSGYFGSGWVIRHKPSQITSPKLLLYHQLNVPFHGFLDLANFLQFITPGRAKFNRNWIVPRNMKVILTFRQNFLAPLKLFSYLSR